MTQTIHGSLISIHGKGVLLCGIPGIGKSRLAFHLVQKGHALVADDTVLLKKARQSVIGFAPKKGVGKLHRRGHSEYDEIEPEQVHRACEVCWVAHLVKGRSLLQTYAKTPTINSQYLLGKLIPEVILPKQPIKLLAYKLEYFAKKLV